jgi:endo-1,3(4)-beta-glucanase
LKIVASYARLVHALSVINNRNLTDIGLSKIKAVLSIAVSNSQKHHLVYENTWGGVVTSWAYDVKSVGVDYGNVIYNDHHFHYGYWVYAASVVATLDPTWISDHTSENKVWVNALIRDFANPVQDKHFPFSRSFDWYHGHSWATGIDAQVDGKNEESTSEDVFAIYAVKLWGHVTGDVVMEARSNLQLAILKRSLRNYFLMESDNKNQPPNFIDNKAPGIVSDPSEPLHERRIPKMCVVLRK